LLCKKKQNETNALNSKISALDKIREVYTHYKGQIIYQIHSIIRDVGVEVISTISEEKFKFSFGEIHPIKITSEILYQCGFKEKTITTKDWKGKFLTMEGFVPIRISQYRANTHFSIYVFDKQTESNAFLRVLDYLHQLQNIYFELSGREMTVKLPFENNVAK
jgi:hypothetical protein